MTEETVDILIEKTDGRSRNTSCRLLSVIYWNLGTE